MYQTSAAFQEIVARANRKLNTRLVENDNVLVPSVKNFTIVSGTDSITIGTAIASYVQVTAENQGVALSGKEVSLEIGLEVDGTMEYVPMGLYTIQNPKITGNKISFTAYDRLASRCNIVYSSQLQYPTDALNVLKEIEDMTGVTIDTTGLSSGIILEQRAIAEAESDEESDVITRYVNPFDGYTCKETIGFIAGLFGRFAVAGRTGNIEFRWYKESVYEIPSNIYYNDLEETEEAFTVGKLTCDAAEETLMSGTGTTGIEMQNPVMKQERLDYIFENVKGMAYTPVVLRFIGDMSLDIGDVVTAVRNDGTKFVVPIVSLQTSYDGGLMQTIGSYGTTQEEDDADTKGPLTEMVERVSYDLAFVKQLMVDNLTATSATIKKLSADVADFENVTAQKLSVYEADIRNLTTGKLDAETADLKYAAIDFANVTQANIGSLFATSGIIKDLVVKDMQITGELAGITVSGDLIKGNTIVADKLVVKGKDGLYYKLNTDGATIGAEQTDYNSLNGQVLQARSITAEKIAVSDLSALNATIGGFHIGDRSIYSGNKTLVSSTTRGIYLDNDGQLAFGDANEYLKFFSDANGKYKLEISADSIKMGSGKQDVQDAIDEIKDGMAISLEMVSSNGTSYGTAEQPNILTIIIHYGNERISDYTTLVHTFGEDASLLWYSKEEGQEEYQSIDSSDDRIRDHGFSFIPTYSDDTNETSFMCRLYRADGSMDPEQETVIERLEKKLTEYVQITLMVDVKEQFEAMKDEVLAEMNQDVLAQIQKNKDDIAELKSIIKDLQYVAIEITAFRCNYGIVEMGSTIEEVVLNWTTNKIPQSLTLNGNTIDVDSNSLTLSNQNIKANTQYTLKATDDRDATSTKTVSITFYNGIYYGASNTPEEINGTFVLKLTCSLQSSKAKTFSTNTVADQYIWYALPSRYGTPLFNVGGFDGGFSKMTTIDFTNASGYTETYDVWKSDNANLGKKTVKVS